MVIRPISARSDLVAQAGLAMLTWSKVALGRQDHRWTCRSPLIVTLRCSLAEAKAATGPRYLFQSDVAATTARAMAATGKRHPVQISTRRRLADGLVGSFVNQSPSRTRRKTCGGRIGVA